MNNASHLLEELLLPALQKKVMNLHPLEIVETALQYLVSCFVTP